MAKDSNGPTTKSKHPGDDGLFGTDDGIPFGALGIAPLGFLVPPFGNGGTDFSGRPDNLQGNQLGRFPRGWQDVALTDPTGAAVSPSAQVIETTDAFGHQTKAVQFLPEIGVDKGIYRAIEPTGHYSVRADVRIDQFSDYDLAGVCGGSEQSRLLSVRLSCWIGARRPGPDRVREDHDRWIAAAFVAGHGHLCRCRIERMEGLRLDR